VQKRSPWLTTLLASVAAFFVGTMACSLVYMLAVGSHETLSLRQTLAGAAAFSVFAAIYGSIPFVCLGIPLFGWLRVRGRASYLTVGAIGVLPGLMVFPWGPRELGMLFLGFGLVVSLLAQFFAKRWEPNQQRAA
jgi:hypothetical protein